MWRSYLYGEVVRKQRPCCYHPGFCCKWITFIRFHTCSSTRYEPNFIAHRFLRHSCCHVCFTRMPISMLLTWIESFSCDYWNSKDYPIHYSLDIFVEYLNLCNEYIIQLELLFAFIFKSGSISTTRYGGKMKEADDCERLWCQQET